MFNYPIILKKIFNKKDKNISIFSKKIDLNYQGNNFIIKIDQTIYEHKYVYSIWLKFDENEKPILVAYSSKTYELNFEKIEKDALGTIQDICKIID